MRHSLFLLGSANLDLRPQYATLVDGRDQVGAKAERRVAPVLQHEHVARYSTATGGQADTWQLCRLSFADAVECRGDTALGCDNVWLDLAGLPPKRLPDYYAGFDLPELARKWIFGTDWPGVPGVARNVRAMAALGLPADVLAGVLSGNAARVYLRG